MTGTGPAVAARVQGRSGADSSGRRVAGRRRSGSRGGAGHLLREAAQVEGAVRMGRHLARLIRGNGEGNG